MTTANRSPAALRRAAILISTLDTRSADALLDKMNPEEAERVRHMVLELDDISPAEQSAVIREFMRAGGRSAARDSEELEGGVELELSAVGPPLETVAAATTGPETASDSVPPGSSVATPESARSRPVPFQFVRELSPVVLARHLEEQHPQLAAVVLAHLSPALAAELVKRFSPRTQADVLRRVAELDLADQEILQDVEQALEYQLREELRSARQRRQGLATVHTILKAAGTERSALLQNLSQHERRLAAELDGEAPTSSVATHPVARPRTEPAVTPPATHSPPRLEKTEEPATRPTSAEPAASAKKPVAPSAAALPEGPHRSGVVRGDSGASPPATLSFPGPRTSAEPELTFEQLTPLSDDDWAKLLSELPSTVVLLALTGASESLVGRLLRRLPKREAEQLRQRLRPKGPLRLSDIDEAQREVARVAAEMLSRGKLTLAGGRGFAAAA